MKIIKIENYNKTFILDNVVIKKFSSKKRYLNELKYRKSFSTFYSVPKIYHESDRLLVINFERLKIPTLTELIKKEHLSAKELLNLINRHYYFTNAFQEKNHNYPSFELLTGYEIKEEKFTLVHGDFRIDNIFYDSKNKEFYLIDFENSGFLFFEFDLAYLYFSILPKNKRLADYILDYVKDNFDFEKFLYSSIFFIKNTLKNPRVNKGLKKGLKNCLLEINQDLKKLKII